ncbi:MAG: NAD-dependent epimerase/dehydratase family protein [Actinobacteria bacterium]|nr:NAD-dependent epimerase/dehydratase family protein [Actinomycetota bacterium]
MKVLVTGATGFIGGNIARKLVENDFEVNVLVRKNSNTLNIDKLPVKISYGDICDKSSLQEALRGCKGLFHAAANYSFWAKNPSSFYEVNVEGTKNIINAAIKAGVEKIIYTSSESTIKLPQIKPGNIIHKNNSGINHYEINDISSVSGDYKKSKVLAELEVLKMIEKKLPVIIINPTTPIGPGDVKPTPTGRIILDFINKKMPAYVNTGLNIVDVEDVALGHVLAFQKCEPGTRYVIGNKNLTLKEIFEILEQITKINAPKIEIPLWTAKTLGYMDEFFSGKILRRHPKIPLAAVKTAYHYRFFDCTEDIRKLGINLTPVELSFKKAVKWFKENGYVKN